jgi:DNA-binding NarL/FixJ family response regulator
VLIVDDHPTMREGLIRVIEREADLRVCGEADSAPQAAQMIKSTKPDLVLLDISLGKHNGIELTAEIVSRCPRLMVLMHSMHEDPVYAQRSLRAGAKGYVAKSEPPENLLKAIRAVLQGEIYLNETIAKQMLDTKE